MKKIGALSISMIALFASQFAGRGLSSFEPSVREPAGERGAGSARGSIQIIPMNSRFPASEMKADGYDVLDLRARLREDAAVEPEPRERDALFRQTGAWSFASRLDQLDRSFLFLRAQEYSATEFAKAYPRMTAKVRAELQTAAKAWGR